MTAAVCMQLTVVRVYVSACMCFRACSRWSPGSGDAANVTLLIDACLESVVIHLFSSGHAA